MSLLFLTHNLVMIRDGSPTFVGRLFVNRLPACVEIVVFTLPFRSFKFFRFAKCLVEPFMHQLLFCHALPTPSCKVNLKVYGCIIYCV